MSELGYYSTLSNFQEPDGEGGTSAATVSPEQAILLNLFRTLLSTGEIVMVLQLIEVFHSNYLTAVADRIRLNTYLEELQLEIEKTNWAKSKLREREDQMVLCLTALPPEGKVCVRDVVNFVQAFLSGDRGEEHSSYQALSQQAREPQTPPASPKSQRGRPRKS